MKRGPLLFIVDLDRSCGDDHSHGPRGQGRVVFPQEFPALSVGFTVVYLPLPRVEPVAEGGSMDTPNM